MSGFTSRFGISRLAFAGILAFVIAGFAQPPHPRLPRPPLPPPPPPVEVKVKVKHVSPDYDFLSEYGDWHYMEDLRSEVWVPEVARGWRPFQHGHWVYANDGEWTWVSYEPYGWLVYHYGYWDYDSELGWYWIPGDDWSPARVKWVIYGDYVCWAPLLYGDAEWPAPWERASVRVWNICEYRHILNDDINQYSLQSLPKIEHREHHWRPVYNPPDVVVVKRFVKRPVVSVRIEREHHGNHFMLRLPGIEVKRVQRYEPTVSRNVIIRRHSVPDDDQQQVQPRSGQQSGGGDVRYEERQQPQQNQMLRKESSSGAGSDEDNYRNSNKTKNSQDQSGGGQSNDQTQTIHRQPNPPSDDQPQSGGGSDNTDRREKKKK